jgi:hypothetical protein
MEWDGYIRHYNNERDDMLMNGNDSEGIKKLKWKDSYKGCRVNNG